MTVTSIRASWVTVIGSLDLSHRHRAEFNDLPHSSGRSAKFGITF
jgi:hypothetical protein